MFAECYDCVAVDASRGGMPGDARHTEEIGPALRSRLCVASNLRPWFDRYGSMSCLYALSLRPRCAVRPACCFFCCRASTARALPTGTPAAAKRTACSAVVAMQSCRKMSKLSKRRRKGTPLDWSPAFAFICCAACMRPTPVRKNAGYGVCDVSSRPCSYP